METNHGLYIFGEGSNHYVGECARSMEELEYNMAHHEPIVFTGVRQVTTFNLPSQRGIQRITKLVTVDLSLGPVSMTVHPTSVRPVTDADMDGYRLLVKDAEADEVHGRAERAGLTTV